MVTRFARIGVVVIAAVGLAAQSPVATRAGESASAANHAGDVTVHEWGTFTTVAGEDGRAVEWLPLGGPSDLPCFVYSFNRLIKGVPFSGPVPDYTTARQTLKGTVRMETPVLYFYAPRPAVVDVSVAFRKGVFSEWYPDASVHMPAQYATLMHSGLTDLPSSGSMLWKGVRILPQALDESIVFPVDRRPSHYYAARMTDASPIQIKGELEKFLFYRGVAGFDSPLAATLADSGAVTITNRSGAEIPRVMLFTRHGSQLGYRVHARLRANQRVTLDRPVADRPLDPGRSLDTVIQDLERTLVAEGLYVKEAKAMIATWRDSWFEDGTRLFYVVPPSTVDAVLPLTVTPKPKSVVRVFVGRAELIDSSDIAIVATALTNHDHRVLERYGRLLGPIADRVIAKTSSPPARADMTAQLDAMLKAYAARLGACGAQSPPSIDTAFLRLFATPDLGSR